MTQRETTSTDLSDLRVLLVHAHPDDESILTGGTIAELTRRGATVTNITCTLGEEGEVIGPHWQGLVAQRADQLGGYRAAELIAALAELGVPHPRMLGGAGTWRDSGMAGATERHVRAFSRSDRAHFAEQEKQLAELIREARPHLVITYDPVGWYGHPDHIRAHNLTHIALARAAQDSAPDNDDAWLVPRLAWVVVPMSAVEDDASGPAAAPGVTVDPDAERRAENRAEPEFEAGLPPLGAAGAVPGEIQDPGMPPKIPPHNTAPLRHARPGELPGWPDAEITHSVSLSAAAQAARAAAMARHATQIRLFPSLVEGKTPTHFALSNNLLMPLLSREHYVCMEPRMPTEVSRGRARRPIWQPAEIPIDPQTLAPQAASEPLPTPWQGLDLSQ